MPSSMAISSRKAKRMANRLLDSQVSVPEAIARVLEQAGIAFVFGMPGGRTGSIYQALYDHQSTIRCVLVREEGLAAVMADVYGRLSGRPGVCMGQGAFMLTNAGMGIVEAHLAGSPVLVLSDLSDGAPFSHHGPYQAGLCIRGLPPGRGKASADWLRRQAGVADTQGLRNVGLSG